MQLGALEYLITINNKGVQQGINQSERMMKESASRADKGVKDFGNKLSAWTIAKGQLIANYAERAISTVTGVVKKSVMAFADYEQLVGGVETLFKDAAGKVQNFAKEAYKSAGISANEYMETVTAFSASLLQSLEGDTSKAADVADMAIKDMADNANKMGSSMESIQNAYRGFSKQNYTMLDNLKLGYGGTKTEMKRLLDDAGKLVNKKFDISNLSDVYEAIHVIQQEMGIFGTTQKEAEGTISGSINMMKASWKDLMVALGSGKNIRDVSKNLTKSFQLVLKNITPVATNAIKNVFGAIKTILPDLKVAIKDVWGEVKKSFENNKLISYLLNKVESLIGFFDLLTDIVNDYDGTMAKLENSNSPLLKGFAKIIKLAKDLGDTLSAVFENSDGNILVGIIKGLVDWLSDNAPELAGIITDVIKSVINALPGVLDAAIDIIDSLIDPLAEIIVKTVDMLVQLLTDEAFYTKLLEVVKKLIGAIVKLLPKVIQTLAENLPVIAKDLGSFIATAIKELISAAPEIIGSLVSIVTDPAFISGIVSALKSAFESLLGVTWDLGSTLLTTVGKVLGLDFHLPTWEDIQEWWTNDIAPNLSLDAILQFQPLADIIAWWNTNIKDGAIFDSILKFQPLQDIINWWKNDIAPHLHFSAILKLFPQIQKAAEETVGNDNWGTEAQQGLQDMGVTVHTDWDANDWNNYMSQFEGTAKGNWRVPYDNFLTRLHRDEMVLTKSQARKYRDGEGNMDYAVVGSMIGNSIERAMGKVYVMMSGEKVGDLTTRRVKRNINASSYAKLRALGG